MMVNTETNTYHTQNILQPLYTVYWELIYTLTKQVNSIQHFIFQLMHTTLKNVELLKHFKIRKTAPTCFGLRGNHHQGTTAST